MKITPHERVVSAIVQSYMNDRAHRLSRADGKVIAAAVDAVINTDLRDSVDPARVAARVKLALDFGKAITKGDTAAAEVFTAAALRIQEVVERQAEKSIVRGTVLWFEDSKGYGFIRPSDGGPDAFVHHSELQMTGFKTLRAGERVEYAAEKRGSNLMARKVRVLD